MNKEHLKAAAKKLNPLYIAAMKTVEAAMKEEAVEGRVTIVVDYDLEGRYHASHLISQSRNAEVDLLETALHATLSLFGRNNTLQNAVTMAAIEHNGVEKLMKVLSTNIRSLNMIREEMLSVITALQESTDDDAKDVVSDFLEKMTNGDKPCNH